MKPIVPAHVREAERQARIQEAKTAALCADIVAQLVEAGWSDVRVQSKATFIAISGNDPASRNHSGAMEDGQSLADFLIAIGVPPPPRKKLAETPPAPKPVDADLTAVAPLTVDTPSVAVEVNAATEGPKEYPEADPREEELERLRAERDAEKAAREAAEKRLAELEARDAPVGLPPNPAETKLSDYYIPAEIRDLMEEGETFPQARKRLSELLNVEKAELRLKRAAGSATEAELKREADVDRLQGLFSKLGEI